MGRRRFEQMLALDPENAGAWTGVGVVRTRQGQLGEAGRAFARALAADPDNEQARQRLRRQ